MLVEIWILAAVHTTRKPRPKAWENPPLLQIRGHTRRICESPKRAKYAYIGDCLLILTNRASPLTVGPIDSNFTASLAAERAERADVYAERVDTIFVVINALARLGSLLL